MAYEDEDRLVISQPILDELLGILARKSSRNADGTFGPEEPTEQESVVVRRWLTTSNAHRDLVIELALASHGVIRILD